MAALDPRTVARAAASIRGIDAMTFDAIADPARHAVLSALAGGATLSAPALAARCGISAVAAEVATQDLRARDVLEARGEPGRGERRYGVRAAVRQQLATALRLSADAARMLRAESDREIVLALARLGGENATGQASATEIARALGRGREAVDRRLLAMCFLRVVDPVPCDGAIEDRYELSHAFEAFALAGADAEPQLR